MPYCGECGQQLSSGAAFCGHCGSPQLQGQGAEEHTANITGYGDNASTVTIGPVGINPRLFSSEPATVASGVDPQPGNALVWPEEPPHPEYNEPLNASSQPAGRKWPVILSVLIVLALAVAGGTAYYKGWLNFGGQKNADSSRSTETAGSDSRDKNGPDKAIVSPDQASSSAGEKPDPNARNSASQGALQNYEKIVSGDRAGYSKYVNTLFGFSVDYPSDYQMTSTSEQEEVFVSPDKKSEIKVYAKAVTGTETLRYSYQQAMNSIPKSSSNFNTIVESDGWYVVTGVDEQGRNIYHKTYIDNGFEKTLVIKRPINPSKPDYDQVIEDVEDSYQPHL